MNTYTHTYRGLLQYVTETAFIPVCHFGRRLRQTTNQSTQNKYPSRPSFASITFIHLHKQQNFPRWISLWGCFLTPMLSFIFFVCFCFVCSFVCWAHQKNYDEIKKVEKFSYQSDIPCHSGCSPSSIHHPRPWVMDAGRTDPVLLTS